jgi:hypothetical protein
VQFLSTFKFFSQKIKNLFFFTFNVPKSFLPLLFSNPVNYPRGEQTENPIKQNSAVLFFTKESPQEMQECHTLQSITNLLSLTNQRQQDEIFGKEFLLWMKLGPLRIKFLRIG